MADKEKPTTVEAQDAPTGGKGKGIMRFFPLILTVVLMPVLAYAMTAFVLIPQLKGMMGAPVHATEAGEDDGHGEEDAHAEADAHGAPAPGESSGHGSSSGHSKEAGAPPVNGEYTYALEKMVVNVANTMAQRFLMVSIVLTSKDAKFAATAEGQEFRLRDLVIGGLRTKSIQDLEQPGAQNQIRTELKSIINNTLSAGSTKPLVNELFFTEFAIQ